MVIKTKATIFLESYLAPLLTENISSMVCKFREMVSLEKLKKGGKSFNRIHQNS